MKNIAFVLWMLGWPYLWHVCDFAFKKTHALDDWEFIIIALAFLVPWIWIGKRLYEKPDPQQLEPEKKEETESE